jgi:4'-phosphopantetheinyl transferase
MPSLGESDVHVWLLNLETAPAELEYLESLLSQEELARAKRFRFRVHCSRFIAARAHARMLLAHYLRCPPVELEFVAGPAGKPALASKWRKAGIEFNLSHSEDLALLAVCRFGPLGVDLEHVRPLDDASELVRRFFSPRESIAFGTLSPAMKSAAFFNLWTRKEALLKGTGEGIAHSLNRVEVTFLPGEPVRLLAAPVSFAGRQWRLCELLPIPGYACALAVAHAPVKVSCWKWLRPASSEKGAQ